MWRHLDDLPSVRVPAGYRLRAYRSGDEKSWVQLVNAAFAAEKRVSVRVRGAAFEGERGWFCSLSERRTASWSALRHW